MPDPFYEEPNWEEKGDVVSTTIRMEGGFGLGPLSLNQQRVERVMFENGEVWDIPDEGPAKQVDYIAGMGTAWRASHKEPSAPTTREAPSGAEYQYNPESRRWEPAPGMPLPQPSTPKPDPWQNPMDGSVLDLSTGKELSPAIPSWIPGRGVPAPQQASQRAPAYPWEEAAGWQGIESGKLGMEKTRLDIEKAKQSMLDPYTLAQQQHAAVIDSIQKQLQSGEITVQEADRLMNLSRANIEATMRGTTPWQMETQRQNLEQTQKSQRENLARSVIGDRAQTGSNLAQGLLSGAGGIYGKILGGPNVPLNFDPFSMATNYTNQMSGGPELAALAKAILSGALQAPTANQPPPQAPGQVPMPGQGGM